MERREFGYLAALAVLPGCSSTAGDGTSEGEQGGDGGATVESGDVPGLGEDGIENVDAFLDAQRAAAEERSHAVSLTETAADTFEDGFKALELRAKYDPSTGRLHLRQWARYPDGDRSQQTEVYSDGSKAGERSILGEDDSRLERLSSSAARDRYTGFRESVRSLLAAVEYGPMEDVTADAGRLLTLSRASATSATRAASRTWGLDTSCSAGRGSFGPSSSTPSSTGPIASANRTWRSR